MAFLKAYGKMRWKTIGIFVLFCGIFAVTFWLYRLPLKAVWYPAAICLILGWIILIYDIRCTYRKHQILGRIRTMLDAATAALPQTDDITEQDYHDMIRLLTEEHAAFRTQTSRHFDDMVDYYTAWAHQIKTPIASMHLTLQNEDSPLSRKLSGDLFRIEQYVEMVLMFLRLDSDSSDYLIHRCDLDAIVRQAIKRYAGEFIARKLRLIYEPLQTTVLSDEKWLSFVIEQVLSNALKYTPSGSIRIFLESPKTLCLQDTGIGIAAEDLPRIFEKGYTGCHGRSDKRASGIGLYLCRRICRNLGHTITAQSAPDAGTTIRIDLSRESIEME